MWAMQRRLEHSQFQSTHPVRGATARRLVVSPVSLFQSTHPVRGATTCAVSPTNNPIFQSTHPVRGATDLNFGRVGAERISIHAPREGCDAEPLRSSAYLALFQSTHPVRGATIIAATIIPSARFQSTHPVRGATRPWPRPPRTRPISIHAPREGCDSSRRRPSTSRSRFQSTHPVRGATNSRRGRRNAREFQSTHPVRGATPYLRRPDRMGQISIHAPREGCDYEPTCTLLPASSFQSTHPVRGATIGERHGRRHPVISIHAPREGCDFAAAVEFESADISIHAPREGCDGR